MTKASVQARSKPGLDINMGNDLTQNDRVTLCLSTCPRTHAYAHAAMVSLPFAIESNNLAVCRNCSKAPPINQKVCNAVLYVPLSRCKNHSGVLAKVTHGDSHPVVACCAVSRERLVNLSSHHDSATLQGTAFPNPSPDIPGLPGRQFTLPGMRF